MIEIDEIVIRVPGMNDEQAKQFGEGVAIRVADGLDNMEYGNKQAEDLDLRLSFPSGTDNDEIMDNVAKQLLQQLTML